MSLHPLNQIVETARNAALSSQSAVARSLHMSTVIGSLPFDSKIKLDHIPVSAQFLATNPIVNPGLDRFMHEMSSAVASLEAKMGYLTGPEFQDMKLENMVHGDLPTRLNVFQHSSRNSVRIVHSLEVSELGDIVPVRLAFGFNFLEAPENLVNSVRAAILEEIARLKMSTDAVKLV